MSEIKLTPQQQAAVDIRHGPVLLSAAAGSGKTKVLVERIFGRIDGEEKLDVDRFLIITYTTAAAEELRSKIAAELSKRLEQRPHDRHLQKQSVLIYRAQISTVHSFCLELVRENAHLLGIAPDMRVLEQSEARLLSEMVLDDILERRYENIEADEEFKALVDIIGAGRDDTELVKVLLEIYSKLRSQPAPLEWMNQFTESLSDLSPEKLGKTPWGQELLDTVKSRAKYWAKAMTDAADDMMNAEKLAAAYSPVFRNDAEKMKRIADACDESWDAVYAQLPVTFDSLGAVRGFEDPEYQNRMKDIRDRYKKAAEKFSKLVSCSQSQACEDIEKVLGAIKAMASVVEELEREFTAAKQNRGGMDFGDLEHYAIRLLTEKDGFSQLADLVSQRYCEVLVDEYQDSNRIQNLIFSAVSDNRKKLFVVGDVKQSIYRFNLADPGIFMDMYDTFCEPEGAREDVGVKLLLNKNFRSRKEICDYVNYVFSNLMSKKFGEIDYGEDQRLDAGAVFPETVDMKVELQVLDKKSIAAESGIEEAEPTYVAHKIKSLLREKFQVTGSDGSMRTVRPEDIVILMRSPSGKAAEYVRQLKKLGIEAQGADDDFMDTVEIKSMTALLEIIDNPRQDIPLVAVLTSPLFGFDNDTLAEIRICDRKAEFFDALNQYSSSNAEIKEFLDILERLRASALDETVEQVLRRCMLLTSAQEIFGAMEGGAARKRNLAMLLEYARKFEGRGYRGVFSFVAWLRQLKEKGEKLKGPESGGRGVRIMSIHRSKGLEFPVVILAENSRKFNMMDVSRPVLVHNDLGMGATVVDRKLGIKYSTVVRDAIASRTVSQQLAEELRVLYVALTRPKDKLIITMTCDDAEKTISKLPVILGKPEPEILESMTNAGSWLLLVSCLPGADRYMERHIVNFIDESAAEPYEDTDEKVNSGESLKEFIGENLNWTYPYSASAELPSKITATQLKKLKSEDEKPAGQSCVSRRPGFLSEVRQLTATERGTALHNVMQFINYEKCLDIASVRVEIERLCKQDFISDEQAKVVKPEKITAFFASEVGQLILNESKVEREFKFSLLLPAKELGLGESEDELLLQGVIDCYLDTAEGLVVIDFKTDSVNEETAGERAEQYRPQLEAYSLALERITGKKVVRRIVYFFAIDNFFDL